MSLAGIAYRWGNNIVPGSFLIAILVNYFTKTNMIKRIPVVLATALVAGVPAHGIAQNATAPKQAVLATVERLFEGMRLGDSAMVHGVFADDANLQTLYRDKAGRMARHKGSLENFLKAVGTPHPQAWDEKIWDAQVNIDGDLAQVWVKYAFFLGRAFKHCGVDAFHLCHSPEGWKIFNLTDTRQKNGCQLPPGLSP